MKKSPNEIFNKLMIEEPYRTLLKNSTELSVAETMTSMLSDKGYIKFMSQVAMYTAIIEIFRQIQTSPKFDSAMSKKEVIANVKSSVTLGLEIAHEFTKSVNEDNKK